MLARLNEILANSNCDLRFKKTGGERFAREKNSLKESAVISILVISIFTIFAIIASNSANKIKTEGVENPPVIEDAWEARLKRDQEEWSKQQERENIPQQVSPAPQNNDTKIASIIVAASCAGKTGLIPRSEVGSTLKKMLDDKGIDSTEVYGNFDYYWGIAKEIDAVNKTYCLK